MLMLGRRQADLDQPQVARHPQVTDQRTDLGIDQQVLGPSLDLHDTLPGQPHIEIFRDGPTQAPVADNHTADPLPFQMRRDTAPGGFDFG